MTLTDGMGNELTDAMIAEGAALVCQNFGTPRFITMSHAGLRTLGWQDIDLQGWVDPITMDLEEKKILSERVSA